MHSYRFYIQPENIHGDQVTLTGDEFHHCCHTLRFGIGSEIEICNGQGQLWKAQLLKIDKKTAVGKIISEITTSNNSSSPIALGIGLMHGAAVESIIENATALGVRRIVPLQTQRCKVRSFNYERYRRVAISALKQSGTTRLPEIVPMQALTGFIALTNDYQLKIVTEQHADIDIRELIRDQRAYQSIAAVVGPEAGLAVEEIDLLRCHGFHAIRLANNRLRSELAVTVLLSYLNLLVQQEEQSGN